MSSTQSSVSSPTSEDIDGDNLENFPDNGLRLEMAPFGLEKLYDYEHGGYHPVHLGDVINERYRIVHKLGNGGFANVWLCRDIQDSGFQYVALKLLMAETSTLDYGEPHLGELRNALGPSDCDCDGAAYISLPLDQFNIQGPNGSHLCFVYPVLGPSVALGLFDSEDPDSVLKSICLKVTKALGFLHQNGICHGDFTPANILHKVSGLQGRSEEEVIGALGEPVQNRVVQQSGEAHDETTAPQYLVYPVRWCDVDSRHISPEPCIIDFGESFKTSDPPEDLGIPGPYRSPEVILEKAAGVGSDLWALGCTLFEIRTGRKIFNLFDDDDDEYLHAMVQVLGPFPEPWWSTTWQKRKAIYRDTPDGQGRAVTFIDEASRKTNPNSTVHPSVAEGARSLQEEVASGLWYMSLESGDFVHRDISPTEINVFAALLSRLLQYRPEDRISAQEASCSDYFRGANL